MLITAFRNGVDAGFAWLFARVYDPVASDRLSESARARVRARQVFAIVRMTPPLMAANIVNAVALLIVLSMTGQTSLTATIWSAFAVTLATYLMWTWIQRRNVAFPEAISEKSIQRLIRNTAFLGFIWALPGILILPHAEGSAVSFLISLHAGMVAGGAIALYPIPAAAMVFSALVVTGGFIGLAMRGDPTIFGYMLVTAAFMGTIWRAISRHARVFVSEFVGRLQMAEQKAIIETLLLDTRAEADEERLRSQLRLAQAQKMEAIGQLTAGIAHDFNNVLAAIQGHVELLAADQPQSGEHVRAVLGSTHRGSELVNQLLTIGGRQRLKPEPVDLPALIERMATMLDRTIGMNVMVETRIQRDVPPALADPFQLEVAILNLALNARDAMPNGGTLRLSCGDVRPDHVTARAVPDFAHDRHVVITVSDTGHGMPHEVRDRAVEPFFTTKKFGAGNGLGLSTVHGFVEQSNGHLTIHSEPGQGTRVEILLPAVVEEAPAIADAAHVPSGHVLVVEDLADGEQVTAGMLRSLGYRVSVARDAREALDRITAGDRPDLVLSDVLLPGGTSGHDLGRAAGDGLRFAFMSGSSALEGPATDKGRGAILRKPCTRDDVDLFVRRALEDA